MKTIVRLALLAGALLTAPARAEPPVAGAGFGAAPVAGCKTDLSYLNQVTGWQTSWPAEWAAIAANPGDAKAQDAAILRWRAAHAALDADIAALKEGVASGRAAPRAVARRVLQQARDLRARLEDPSSDYFPKTDSAFAADWRALLREEIAPAIDRYEAFLVKDYVPNAGDDSALASLKDDGACFRGATQWWTTLSMTDREIEAAGERILGDARQSLVALSPKRERFSKILRRLRSTPATSPIDEAKLIALSAAALARANEKIGAAFLKAPPAALDVAPMAEHMQASFPAGFYQPADGGKAAYVINPSRPAERRLMAEAIAFHEGVPGHHLFFAYPRENEDGAFNAGLAEGWAIYAETLADEMGLYGSTLDREGMHAKHLWSASRLIIEPRLHSGRWSRDDAVAFMRRVTALPDDEIAIEIDRYLAMPGQSLSYSLGADVILRARARAKAALGDKFDIKAFHDVIVAPGLRPLEIVEADVNAWIKAQAATPIAK